MSKKKSNKASQGEEDKKPIIIKILNLLSEALFPRELIRLNKGAIKASEIYKNPYWKRQVFLNRVIISIIVLPIIVAGLIVYISVTYDEFVTPYLMGISEQVIEAIKSKNWDAFKNLSLPSITTVNYVGYTILSFGALVTSSVGLAFFLRCINPLIKETIELENLLRSNNYWDEERMDFILSCPVGVLFRYNGEIQDILKNNEFWKRAHKIPGDVMGDENDDTIYFIKGGFKLRAKYNYEY